MLSILLLGLLLGLQHALDADHLAAVASLSTHNRNLRDAARQGAAWGLGHSLTLLLLGGTLLMLNASLPDWTVDLLQAGVGLMLLALGLNLLYRLWSARIHFHSHRHGPQTHFHAHSHAPGIEHRHDPHHHAHPRRLPLRALLVGSMHGMAGTAALLVLTLGSVSSVGQGLLYLAVFGVGSIIGMSVLAVVISAPLRWSANRLTWAHNALNLVFGLATVGIGSLLLQHSVLAMIAAHSQ
ncbi:MAG: urease accessory protein [Gammaproteobacteria bacterium]|nr:urease accessory protein [Gammaproteobacteria bacterium]